MTTYALETANSGHPVGAARWEAGQVRDVLMYYSAAPERMAGRRELGPDALDAFTEVKNVFIAND